MASQVVAILALILGREHLQQFYIVGTFALWVAVITAVASAIDYYRRFSHVLLNQSVQRASPAANPAPEASRRFKQVQL
jgi:uncharacterized membrane protein